ncbi:hypothetical protein [uncultured Nostoc sp.]|uniref:hypothetical protein n=1 Tax=uncultured Nostoc sp. TaxID=340711 RepID=UPI0035CB0940
MSQHYTAAFALGFLQAEKRKLVSATGLTHLQLLPLHYDFYERKSENKNSCCWHICGYCPCVTIFTISKAKTGICDRPDISAAAAPALRFLQAENRKQVPATGLTHLQLLPPHYDFLQAEKQKQVRATGLTDLQLLPPRF